MIDSNATVETFLYALFHELLESLELVLWGPGSEVVWTRSVPEAGAAAKARVTSRLRLFLDRILIMVRSPSRDSAGTPSYPRQEGGETESRSPINSAADPSQKIVRHIAATPARSCS